MKNKGHLQLFYSMTLLFLCLPFFAFITRGDFLNLQHLEWEGIVSSLRVSLISSSLAMVMVVVIGLPAGYYMSRETFKYKSFFDVLFHLPQVLPPAVIGLLLLLTYGNNGFVGRHLQTRLSFSLNAVVLTFMFVSLPLFIKGVSVAFSEVDPKLEQTARMLGDSPWQAFRRITLPLSKKGVIIALIMAWSRGISEFGATMMFAGNLPGVTQTLPLAIYTALETNLNNALFLAFIMFSVALILLIVLERMSRDV